MNAFKKSTLVIALFAAAAGAQAADVYGNIDAGLGYSKVNGAALTSVDSGQSGASFFGIKSSEDLDGGLKAIVTLEAGINIDDGSTTANRLFSREASIGIASHNQTFKIGRLESLSRTSLREFDAFGDAPWGVARMAIDTSGNYINNSVLYSFADKGVKVSAEHSFGERVGGGVTAGSSNEVQVAYAFGQSAASVTRTQADAGPTTTMVAASHDFGVAKASLVYQDSKNSMMDNSVVLGVTAPVGHSIKVLASVGQEKLVTGASVNLMDVGATYALSQRTSVYTAFSKTNATNLDGKHLSIGMAHKF